MRRKAKAEKNYQMASLSIGSCGIFIAIMSCIANILQLLELDRTAIAVILVCLLINDVLLLICGGTILKYWYE
jgi:hypothetical protein